MSKNIKTRIQHKHDIEANWLLAENFIPLQGELIVYDIEVAADGTVLQLPEGRTEPYGHERIKIGDGVTNVNNLPFYAGSWNDLEDRPFGEETRMVNEPLNIVWDGNTTDKVSVENRYKVSDAALTNSQIMSVTVARADGSEIGVRTMYDTLEAYEASIFVQEDVSVLAMSIYFVRKDGGKYGGITFPEKGIYFVIADQSYDPVSLITTEPIEHTKTVAKPLDEKYLPDSVATTSYVDDAIAAIEIPDVSNFITEVPAEYITESELEAKGYLTEHQSLAGLATESFVAAEIAKAKLEGEDVDLSGYATKDDIKNFITEVPAEYVTESELNAKGYLTEHQDISGKADKVHAHPELISSGTTDPSAATTSQFYFKYSTN